MYEFSPFEYILYTTLDVFNLSFFGLFFVKHSLARLFVVDYRQENLKKIIKNINKERFFEPIIKQSIYIKFYATNWNNNIKDNKRIKVKSKQIYSTATYSWH